MSEIKTYRVAGGHKVFGHEPGQEFERAIDPTQEARLLASGAIEQVSGRPADSDPEPVASRPWFFKDDNEEE